MSKKKLSLYKVLKGTFKGLGYAAAGAGGYVAGVYVAGKVYERTGDYLPATVAGGMAGIVVTEAGFAVVDATAEKADAIAKKSEQELAAEATE